MILRFTVVLAFAVCNVVEGYTSYLRFDNNCDDDKTRTLYSDDTYYVRWNGTSLSYACSFRFSPSDIHYKVCVEATRFYIPSCSTTLKYYGGLIGSILINTYSCYDSTPNKYCGDYFDDVKIRLTTSYSPSLLPGYFTLKVTTKKQENQSEVGVVAGSVVGCIVVTIIIVAIVVVVCRRRRYHPPIVVATPAKSTQIVTSTSSAYSGGIANPSYPNSAPYNGQNNAVAGGVMNSYPSPYGATPNYPPPYTGRTTSYPNSGQNNTYPFGTTTAIS